MNECIICFEPIEIKQNINLFKDCEHYNGYHYNCANEWIKKCINNGNIPSCPICRNESKLYIQQKSLPVQQKYYCLFCSCCFSLTLIVIILINIL